MTSHQIGLVFSQNVRLNLLYLNVLIVKYWTNSLQHKVMKSKDFQKLVLSKYETGQIPKKIFEDLNVAVSYPTDKRWCKMIRKTGVIDLSKPSDGHNSWHEGAYTKDQKKIKGQ